MKCVCTNRQIFSLKIIINTYSIIYNYLQNAPTQKVVVYEKEDDKEVVPPKKQRKLESSSSSSKVNDASEENDFDIDLSDGGAGGKELHGFLIKALKKLRLLTIFELEQN